MQISETEAFSILGQIGVVTHISRDRRVLVDGAHVVVDGKELPCTTTSSADEHPAVKLVRELTELPEGAHVLNMRGNQVRLFNLLWARIDRDKAAQAAESTQVATA